MNGRLFAYTILFAATSLGCGQMAVSDDHSAGTGDALTETPVRHDSYPYCGTSAVRRAHSIDAARKLLTLCIKDLRLSCETLEDADSTSDERAAMVRYIHFVIMDLELIQKILPLEAEGARK